MCIGFWSLDDPIYSLILCANRDEFLDRPTLPAAFHNFSVVSVATTPSADASGVTDRGELGEGGSVLSGIDIRAGGTWLGINKRGRVAFITNITEPLMKCTVSRGVLTSSFLKQQPQRDCSTLSQYIDYVKSLGSDDVPLDVGGFNLIAFEPRSSPTSTSTVPGGQLTEQVTLSYEAALITNSGSGGRITTRPIGRSVPTATHTSNSGGGGEDESESGCGGISNAIDGSTVDGLGSSAPWTKVPQGRKRFSEILAQHRHQHSIVTRNSATPSSLDETSDVDDNNDDERLAEDLFALLGTTNGTSLPLTQHERRNSIFIPPAPTATTALYGTRLSTVMLVRRHSRNVLFIERDRAGMITNPNNGSGGSRTDPPVPVPVIYDAQTGKRTQRTFRFQIEPYSY